MEHVAGVILAGGQARRMGGGDKCLLRLADGRTLLERIIARLAPQVTHMALNANGDPARFAACGLPVLPDNGPDGPTDAGPLAGVLAGMEWAAAQGCDRVVTVAGDTPFFPRDLVARLVAGQAAGLAAEQARAPGAHRVAIAATDRAHPVFALWDVRLAPVLAQALAEGTRRVMDFAAAQGAARIVFAHGDAADPFFNINTPDDLEQANRIALQEDDR